jgi:hypothetical protein
MFFSQARKHVEGGVRIYRLRLTLIAAACLGTVVAPLAATGAPIGPSQHFAGRVNGQTSIATVHTVCPGPGTAGQFGSIASGQTVSVHRVASGHGYTGLFSQVYAWFVQNESLNGHHAAVITTYRTKVAIPTSVRVPCDGTGRVEFSSCPYLAPCAAGWEPTFVRVRYENIAV